MTDREHPPSSPCRHSSSYEDTEYTSYLIGCYETYRRPFVWVRTGHERLVNRLVDFQVDIQVDRLLR